MTVEKKSRSTKWLLPTMLVVAALSPSFEALAQNADSAGKGKTSEDTTIMEEVTTPAVTGRFNQALWKNPPRTRPGLDRMGIFLDFLKDYNLIGMERSQLVGLLGPSQRTDDANQAFYYLEMGMCGNDYTGLNIEIADGKVKRWRVVQPMGTFKPIGTWITENVVCTRNTKRTQYQQDEVLIYTPKSPAK